MISSSFSGLTSNNVTIVDQLGNLLKLNPMVLVMILTWRNLTNVQSIENRYKQRIE